jgi:hypothetical protein
VLTTRFADSSPDAQRMRVVALGALPGDWVPGRHYERVPPGRAWLEAPPAASSSASPLLPLALVQGRVACVLWPPAHARRVPCGDIKRTPQPMSAPPSG